MTKIATKKKTSAKTPALRPVIIGSGAGYGLCYGMISATDAEIVATHAVRVTDCQHIAYWEGGKGGLTSLAAAGPMSGSRIGAPVASALITGVINVFDVAPDAARVFAAHVNK